jgi:predicted RecA/RadA family phage recombinase
MADLVGKVLLYGDGKHDRVNLPVASATAIVKGEFVCWEAGYITKMDAASDDATFVGVSEMDHAANAGIVNLTVITKCVVLAPATTASYSFGAALKYNTGGYLEAAGGADTIAHAWEDNGTTSITSLKVMVDTYHLGKLFLVSA